MWHVYNDACYYLSNPLAGELTNLPEFAENFCNIDGSHLVSIHSEEENNFISSLLEIFLPEESKSTVNH